MRRILLQPAYILHQRAYRNTSAILEVLTRDYGRVGIIAKGVKGKNGVGRRGVLQSFQPLLISYCGRQDLCMLTAVESSGDGARLSGQLLFSAFYLNELLVRLLQRGDPHDQLFHAYGEAIARLKKHQDCEPVLRRFEISLLQQLGYGLSLETDAMAQAPIQADARYYYDPVRGPVPVQAGQHARLPSVSGACLQALAQANFSDRQYWAEMKILMRGVIAHHMDGRPLNSRELFRNDD